MYCQLNEKQKSWVTEMISSMSMEEKIAQLLHPYDKGYTEIEIEELVKKVPIGSFFSTSRNFSEMKSLNQTIQKNSKIPVLISADMENGTNFIKDKGVYFPFQMGLAASGIQDAGYRMGKITSLICRAAGVHWTFSPVIDLNLNPENPITNIRALGDRPEKIIPIFPEIIRGLQEDGRMAATCKHFPGDGVDNRDQHMLVSVNSLPRDQWDSLYGIVWKKAIKAGTKAIMCGHISFPDYQGMRDDPDQALPATLSKKLMTDLLRNELGFQGVIVSDAFTMVGFTCRFPENELAWRNVEYLRPDLKWAPVIEPITHDRPFIGTFNADGTKVVSPDDPFAPVLPQKGQIVTGVGLGRTFGRLLAESFPDHTVGLIPTAVGGTSIAAWLPGGIDDGDPNAHPYDTAILRTKEAMKTGRLVAILWHQGENDAAQNTPQYKEKLRSVVLNFRKDLDLDDSVPFIAGEMASFYNEKFASHIDIIDHALEELKQEFSFCRVVKTNDLDHRGDNLHFCTASLHELGARYFAAYQGYIGEGFEIRTHGTVYAFLSSK